MFAADRQLAGGTVNPACGSFDFSECSHRSFVQHHVAFPVTPLRAELLVSEGWAKPQRLENFAHLRAVRQWSFILLANLVPAYLALCFMGEDPFIAVFAEPQNLSTLAQRRAGLVVKSIDLVRTRSDLAKPSRSQLPNQSSGAFDPEFDFHFI